MPEDTKRCPYCAEEIKKDAIYCRFCKHDLPTVNAGGMPKLTNLQNHSSSQKQKEKKNNRVRNIVLVLIFLAIVILCIMTQTNKRNGGSPDYNRVDYSATNSAAATRKAASFRTVEYKLNGSATTVDVTLSNADGNTEQYDNVSLDKTYTYKMEVGEFLYVSAQNQGQSGSVSCKIYVNGKLVESATSSGAYVIATCSGSAE